MAFGGKVGDAWIELHAYGSDNPTDVKRAARADAKAYKDGFIQEMERGLEDEMRQRRARLGKAINQRDFQALADALGTDTQKAGERFNLILDKQAKRWKINAAQASMLRRIVGEMEEEFLTLDRQRRDWAVAETRQIQEHTRYLKEKEQTLRAQQRLGREMAKDTEARIDAERRRLNQLSDAFDRLVTRRGRTETDTIAEILLGEEEAAAAIRRADRVGISMDRLRRRLELLSRDGAIDARQFETVIHRMSLNVDRDVDNQVRSFGRLRRTIRVTGGVLRTFDDIGRRFTRTIGRFSGRGSRNDFLHFIGMMSQFAASIVTFPLRLLSGITSGIGDLIGRFAQFRQAGMGAITAGFAALGPLMVTAAGAAVALAGGFLAMSFVFPALISGITLLAGALTVLVGAITVGILGGLVAVLPLLGALLVGLGGAALVAKAFADNSDEAKQALSGFVDVFDELVQRAEPIMERVLRIAVRLEDEFEALGNVGLAAADGIASGFERFVDGVESPEMSKFFSMWGESIPKIVESLSRAMADFALGLVAWLAPVLPYAEALADNIERGAERFKEWASSEEGQNAISGWLNTAWEAAGHLWNTLVNIGDILGTIFTSATEGAGNNFLGWLEEVTEEWGTFLRSAEGQEAMRGFWEDVSEFARNIKELVDQFVDTWNALDTDTSRENFQLILDVVTIILQKIEEWAPAIEAAGSLAAGIATGLTLIFAPVISLLDRAQQLGQMLGLIKDPIKEATKRMEESSKRIGTAIKGLEFSPIQVEFDTPAEQELRSRGDASARAFGDTFKRNVEGILTLALTGMVDASPEAIRAEARRMTQEWDSIGVIFADAYTTSLNRQIVEGSGTTVERLTDVQKAMLKAAEIDPEAFARATRASEALATWTSMLVEDMTAGAQQSTDAFGNQFVGGMAGWTSPIAAQMTATGVEAANGLSNSLLSGLQTAEGQMSGRALTLASSISSNFGTGLGGIAIEIATKMGEGVLNMQRHAERMVGVTDAQFSTLPNKISPSMNSTVSVLSSKMAEGINTMARSSQNMVSDSASTLGTLPSKADAALAFLSVRLAFQMAKAAAAAARGAATIVSSGSNIRGMVGAASAALSGLAGAIGYQMARAYDTASYWANRIRNVMSSASSMASSGGTSRFTASGGIFFGAQERIIGEAGPEAVVPLNRSLSMVDPSVRGLSAIAQGLGGPGGSPSLVVEDGAIRVTTNVVDPGLVAESVLDRLYVAAQG